VSNENKEALAQYRLEQSHECLKDAVRDIEAEAYKAAANRSYFCVFHAMRAVLALDGFDSKKHSGIISVFRQRYIKTGIFSSELSDIIQNAFNTRGKSDYEDFFVVSKEQTKKQVEDSDIFLTAIKSYTKKRLTETPDTAMD
jgi:uncharacterized protein (UPF0332 family)